MPLHNLGADEQTESGSGNPIGALRPVAALENELALRFGYADAVIAHRDASEIRRGLESHLYVAALR